VLASAGSAGEGRVERERGSLGACVVFLGFGWLGSCGLVAWSFLEKAGGSREGVLEEFWVV
jgi:hypothetical protein